VSDVVIDASIAAKWFFPEVHSDRAQRLLSGRTTLLAPDLILAEFANVAWKRFRRREITADQAGAIVGDFLRFPVRIFPSARIIPAALDVALGTGRTLYDGLYVALALDRACRLVTADERLVNALSAGPFADHVVWIGQKR